MGIFKDLLIGGAALKALKQSNRPGVVPPSSCTVIGMKHIGFGRTWKIDYIENNRPNIKFQDTNVSLCLQASNRCITVGY